jgi:hypothetical protein
VISLLQVPLERFLCEAQQPTALVAVETALDLLRKLEQARNERRIVRCVAFVFPEALLQLCAHTAVWVQSVCLSHTPGRSPAWSGGCAPNCRLAARSPFHGRPRSGQQYGQEG